MTEVDIEFSGIEQTHRMGKCPACKTLFENRQFYIEIESFHGYLCSLDCMKVVIENGLSHTGPVDKVCIYCDQPWPKGQEV